MVFPLSKTVVDILHQLNDPSGSAERIASLVSATRRDAIRLRLIPVGERRKRRGLLELLAGKPRHQPPPVLPRDASKVGGVPWLDSTERWPRDSRGEPLAFMAQLRFREMPHHPELPSDGLLCIYKGPDVSAISWHPTVTAPPAEIPDDAPPPVALRECQIVGTAMDMYDVPRDLRQACGEHADDLDDMNLDLALLENVSAVNGSREGNDHVILGYPGEHGEDEDLARAAKNTRWDVVRPYDYSFVNPADVPGAELRRWRLLLTMSFDTDFTPAGDNNFRLFIRDDDLMAHRLERTVPVIHVVG